MEFFSFLCEFGLKAEAENSSIRSIYNFTTTLHLHDELKNRAMNTYACFMFLLAVGLSAQKSEFEIDFQSMVNTVKMNDRTLLVSTTIHDTHSALLRRFKKYTFLNFQTSDILSLIYRTAQTNATR